MSWRPMVGRTLGECSRASVAWVGTSLTVWRASAQSRSSFPPSVAIHTQRTCYTAVNTWFVITACFKDLPHARVFTKYSYYFLRTPTTRDRQHVTDNVEVRISICDQNLSAVKRCADHSTAVYSAVLQDTGDVMFGVGDFTVHNEITPEYVR